MLRRKVSNQVAVPSTRGLLACCGTQLTAKEPVADVLVEVGCDFVFIGRWAGGSCEDRGESKSEIQVLRF
jgi:hypothetical protein